MLGEGLTKGEEETFRLGKYFFIYSFYLIIIHSDYLV